MLYIEEPTVKITRTNKTPLQNHSNGDLPSTSLLNPPALQLETVSAETLEFVSMSIENKLSEFGVEAKIEYKQLNTLKDWDAARGAALDAARDAAWGAAWDAAWAAAGGAARDAALDGALDGARGAAWARPSSAWCCGCAPEPLCVWSIRQQRHGQW